jgi:hypothetical protein
LRDSRRSLLENPASAMACCRSTRAIFCRWIEVGSSSRCDPSSIYYFAYHIFSLDFWAWKCDKPWF